MPMPCCHIVVETFFTPQLVTLFSIVVVCPCFPHIYVMHEFWTHKCWFLWRYSLLHALRLILLQQSNAATVRMRTITTPTPVWTKRSNSLRHIHFTIELHLFSGIMWHEFHIGMFFSVSELLLRNSMWQPEVVTHPHRWGEDCGAL